MSELEDLERVKRTLRFSGIGIGQVDKDFDTTYVNTRMAEILGYSAEEMIGNNLLSFVPEDMKNMIIEYLNKRDVNEDHKFEFLRKDGNGISTLVSAIHVFDADGKFERGTIAAIDITKQKGLEDVLEASRNTLETIFTAISYSLRPVDREGRIVKLMNRIRELLDTDASICGIQEKQQIIDELRLHTEHLKELVEERVSELLKAERMAAVGQAAAMIAHDLRNPLQDIRLAQYLLGKRYPNERKLLNQIDRNVEYANGVINSLLIYSQEHPLTRKETNINKLLMECLTESALPQHIIVEKKLREVPSIYVDQNQMKRLFKNLVLNAIQAMEGGGTLALESNCVENSVVISIRDTGEGISETKQGLIWKPFYTSKAKGMGLGLSVVKRVVEMHSGTIDMESNLGKGSTFTVHIPTHKPSVTTFNHLE